MKMAFNMLNTSDIRIKKQWSTLVCCFPSFFSLLFIVVVSFFVFLFFLLHCDSICEKLSLQFNKTRMPMVAFWISTPDSRTIISIRYDEMRRLNDGVCECVDINTFRHKFNANTFRLELPKNSIRIFSPSFRAHSLWLRFIHRICVVVKNAGANIICGLPSKMTAHDLAYK